MKFTVIGGGSRLTELQERAHSRALSNVVFLPRVDQESLSESLAACDVALVSLQDGLEGLSVPSKYYAILASGRPVLALMAKAAEVARSVIEDECGYVLPSGDPEQLASRIRQLKADPSLARQLGNNARQAFERRYTLHGAVDSYIGLLQSLPRTKDRSTRTNLYRVWLLLTVLSGIAGVALAPLFLWIPPILGLLALLALVPSFRLTYVILGGLLVLSSSHTLDAGKVVYFVGAAVSVVAALARLRGRWSTAVDSSMQPLLVASLALSFVLVVSFVVAKHQGTPIVAWLRDAAPYMLLTAVPLFVVDASPRREALLQWGFVLSGLLSALSFSVQILSKRQTVHLPVDHLLLPSAMLPIGLYCFATAAAIVRGQIRWIALAVAVLMLLLVSGSRTYLVLLAVPLVLLPYQRRFGWRRLAIVLGIGLASLIVLVVAVGALAHVAGGEVERTAARFRTLPQLVLRPSSDLSYRERAEQTNEAWQAFVSHPLFGVGPGHIFKWHAFDGSTVSTFNIDTSLSLAAKFGLIGVAAFSGLALAWVAGVRRMMRAGAGRVSSLALVGYLVATIALLPLAPPFEDKGFSFAWIYLLGLGCAALAARRAVSLSPTS